MVGGDDSKSKGTPPSVAPLREEIDKLTHDEGSEPPKSEREFIQQRMRVLDKDKNKKQ